MTAREASELLVDLTQHLSAARTDLREVHAERDAYRLVAQQAIAYASKLARDLTRTEQRYRNLLDEYRRSRRREEAA